MFFHFDPATGLAEPLSRLFRRCLLASKEQVLLRRLCYRRMGGISMHRIDSTTQSLSSPLTMKAGSVM